MRQIFQFPVSSATLPTPQHLEQNLLSRNPGAVPQVTSNYAALYGTVMPATDAPQPVRDLVDMTDAEAQAAMKKAVEIDALADLELQAAEQINQQLQTAAPGARRFSRPKHPRGWCGPMRTRSRRWRNWCASAQSSLPIRERNSSSARLIPSTLHNNGSQVLQQGAH